MSVSSVEGAASVVAPPPIEMQPVETRRAADKDDTRLAPPQPRAALPPGQGTRVDQLA